MSPNETRKQKNLFASSSLACLRIIINLMNIQYHTSSISDCNVKEISAQQQNIIIIDRILIPLPSSSFFFSFFFFSKKYILLSNNNICINSSLCCVIIINIHFFYIFFYDDDDDSVVVRRFFVFSCDRYLDDTDWAGMKPQQQYESVSEIWEAMLHMMMDMQ